MTPNSKRSQETFSDHWERYQRIGGFPRNSYIACKNSKMLVRRLDVREVLGGHDGCVNTVNWNKTGNLLLSGSDDQYLNIYSYPRLKLETKIRSGHHANIFNAKFIPHSNDLKICSCSGDGMLHYNHVLNSADHGRHPFKCHSGIVYDVTVHNQDPHGFMSCGEDGTVRYYDLRSTTSCLCSHCSRHILLDVGLPVTGLTINPLNPNEIVLACDDGTIRAYDRRFRFTQSAGRIGRPPRASSAQPIPGLLYAYRPPRSQLNSVVSTSQNNRLTCVTFNSTGDEILASYCPSLMVLISTSPKGSYTPSMVNETKKNLFNNSSLFPGNLFPSQRVDRILTPYSVRDNDNLNDDQPQISDATDDDKSSSPVPLSRSNNNVTSAYRVVFNQRQLGNAFAIQQTVPSDPLNRQRRTATAVRRYLRLFNTDQGAIRFHRHESPHHTTNANQSELLPNNEIETQSVSEDNTLLGPDEHEQRRDNSQSNDSFFSQLSSETRVHSSNASQNTRNTDERIVDDDYSTQTAPLLGWNQGETTSNEAIADNQHYPASSPRTNPPATFNDNVDNSETNKNQTEKTTNTTTSTNLHYNPYHFNSVESLRTMNENDRLRIYLNDIFIPEYAYFYHGHHNSRTMIKECNFYGEDFVMSGSDDGNVFIWEKKTGIIVNVFKADDSVVNCVQPHPVDPIIACSGIDSTIKVVAPTKSSSVQLTNLNEIISANEREMRINSSFYRYEATPTMIFHVLMALERIQRTREDGLPTGRLDPHNNLTRINILNEFGELASPFDFEEQTPTTDPVNDSDRETPRQEDDNEDDHADDDQDSYMDPYDNF